MQTRTPDRPGTRVGLPDDVARQILARAAELDLHRRDGTSIPQLREAAQDAGIAAEAFDAAVSEWQESSKLRGVAPRAPSPRAQGSPRDRGRRIGAVIMLAAGLIAFGAIAVTRLVLPVHQVVAEPVPAAPR